MSALIRPELSRLRSGPDATEEETTDSRGSGSLLIIWACFTTARYVLIVDSATPSCANDITI